MEIIGWVVSVIGDCEGRSIRDVASFTTQVEAVRFANSDQGRDMYGSPGMVRKLISVFYETAEDAGAKTWNLSEKDAAKAAALAKLTKDERQLLGIKD